MTKKDFFRTIIKLFGLYSAITAIFYMIPANIAILFPEFHWDTILYLFVATATPVLMFVYLIFKVDVVIGMLRLDKGFDDDRVEFGNLTAHQLIAFSCILIGGFLIIDNLIQFLMASANEFSRLVSVNYPVSSEIHTAGYGSVFNWLYAGLSIFMGYLLITNASWIGHKLSKVSVRPMNRDSLDR